ncbi:MAG: tRNA (N6-threonylcarbamoyladenosine(37)-N6)-methyltransferase TrmO [Candidatus Thorarchaeota archaeon]
MEMKATAVGYVKKPENGQIFIEIEENYWDATLAMDMFSHIIVLWWITGRDNPSDRSNLQDYPPVEDAGLSGVFASRSPARPTPIGMTTVRIRQLDADQHRIYLDQIDAKDGTPVVDIKPYMPFSDKVDCAKVPEWFKNNVPRYTTNPLS